MILLMLRLFNWQWFKWLGNSLKYCLTGIGNTVNHLNGIIWKQFK